MDFAHFWPAALICRNLHKNSNWFVVSWLILLAFPGEALYIWAMTEQQKRPDRKGLSPLWVFSSIGLAMVAAGILALLNVIHFRGRVGVAHAILLIVVGLLNIAIAPFSSRKK
jgi:uncharacterized membrane protein HdeD (DUF308 family)